MNSQELGSIFEEIISLINGGISEFQEKNIRELVEANEWGIALEILCDCLYEDTIAVPQRVYQLIEKAGIAIGVDEEYWTELKEQVSET